MSRVLVLTAVDVEARALARLLGLPRVAASAWPHYQAGALEVLGVGLGASALVARTAVLTPSLVISAGACGALSPTLAEGTLVVPEAVVTPEGARHVTAALPGLTARGTLLSVTAVVDSPAAKARLWMETGALAVDMESGAVLAWAARRGVPAAVVRGVSDPADRAVPRDLAGVVDAEGRVRSLRAVGVALSRPGAVADAIALRRGTQAALRAVAAALGRLART